jgi:predicted RNA methylase
VKRVEITSDVEQVLCGSTVDGDVLTLPGQMDRELYVRVDKVLKALGGKWNRKLGGHVFEDPGARERLDEVLAAGVVDVDAYGYFPTPAPLVVRLIELADIRPGQRALEPSAGRGAICDALREAGAEVVAAELQQKHAAVLRDKGYAVYVGDFLELASTLPGPFDRVVMNPPFENGQDIAHVVRAFDLLVPGGRLVAVMAAGVAFREDGARVAMRSLIEECGSMEHNEAEAFKASGTGVQSVTVTLERA